MKFPIIIFMVMTFWNNCFAEINWQGIVIHHSATEGGTVESFDSYHKQIGFDEIGYHYVIYKDGSVHEGRSLNKVGAHAKGRNKTHIGICLVGNETFTKAQILELGLLNLYLSDKYNIKSIERHHEQCPGEGLGESIFFK